MTAQCLERLLNEGPGDFAQWESGYLAALRQDGARLLEQALNDPQLPLPDALPGAGEEDAGSRCKSVRSCLGWLRLKRRYFYDAPAGSGRLPLDRALGLVDSATPLAARWMCRAGALAGSYQAASQDLLAYAGLEIDPSQIQRLIGRLAPVMDGWREAQPPVFDPAAGEVFCVSVDGTGSPMRRRDLRGHQGKNGQRAKTLEVKVAALYTHHKPKQAGEKPERDYGSSSYLARMVSAAQFGPLVRAEAQRRGIARAKETVFLGDGAAWIWKLARNEFPAAVCILDYYHGCEHLQLLANALEGEGSPQAKRRFRRWRKALLKNGVEKIVAQALQQLPAAKAPRQAALKEIAYLRRNRARMQYQTFRQAGYFIGSGVVEAACKTVVGQRLKQSGMLWSRQGAAHLLTVRCALLSGWFDAFWKAHAAKGKEICLPA